MGRLLTTRSTALLGLCLAAGLVGALGGCVGVALDSGFDDTSDSGNDADHDGGGSDGGDRGDGGGTDEGDDAGSGGGADAGRDGGGGGRDGGGDGGGSDGGGADAGRDAGGGGADAGGGGGCTPGGSLAAALRVTAVSVTPAPSSSVVHYTETSTGGAIAWSSSNGVYVTAVSPSDTTSGPTLPVTGSRVLGLASAEGEYAVLVAQAPDKLTVARVTAASGAVRETVLIAGGDHAVVGNEWFGEFAQTGRLARIQGGYAAYSAVHRRWSDGIGHQGDQLRRVPDTGTVSADWTWGCSHSGDQRLLWSPAGLAAVCLSDCYPSKGMHFRHRGGVISEEPSGNCAGVYGGQLGGFAPSPDGFWFTYSSREGRASDDIALVRLSSQGAVLSRTWVAATGASETEPQLATFAGGLLAGWRAGGVQQVLRLDASGAVVGSVETVSSSTAPFPRASDWVTTRNGDVVWAFAQSGAIRVARFRACAL